MIALPRRKCYVRISKNMRDGVLLRAAVATHFCNRNIVLLGVGGARKAWRKRRGGIWSLGRNAHA
jgi:hypothetical protein